MLALRFFAFALLANVACGQITSSSQSVKPQPLVTFAVGGKAVPLLVDTGSSAPLILFPGVAGEQGTVAIELRTTAKGPLLAKSADILTAKIPGAKGIVGWPVLKRSIWKLDLPTASHQFLAAFPEEARGWPSFPIVATRNSLAIRHPKLGEVFLDSGARRGVCLSPARWETWKRLNPGHALTLTEGFSPSSPGGVFANPVAYGVSFPLAPLTLNQTNVGEAFFDSKHDDASVLLGLEALAGVTMVVDGPGGRVYFQENPRASRYRGIPPNRLQIAFLPDPAGTNATCAKLLPGSPATGLKDGDVILSLNGGSPPPTFDQMHEFVRQRGAKGTFRIRRNREILQLSIAVP